MNENIAVNGYEDIVADGYDHLVAENEYEKFVELHKVQLLSSRIPDWFWKTLYYKLEKEIFDSVDTFQLKQFDCEGECQTNGLSVLDMPFQLEVICTDGIKHKHKKHIYLVDHAWTFRINDAKQQLLEIDGLINRMCNIMGIQGTGDNEAKATEICKRMWKYCQTYSIGNATNVEDGLPIWYIMDELGCGIKHSDTPNFRAVPFYYVPQHLTYTLIFPITDLEIGDLVTRDYIENVTNELERSAMLVPWIPNDLSYLDFSQTEPDESYFLSGHIQETLPVNTDFEVTMPDKIKVYSEYDMVNKFLNNDRFVLIDDENSADILWYTRHFKTYAELGLTPNKFVNQFPYENVLTIKDLLSIVCRRNSNNFVYEFNTLEMFPNWYPVTFNLKTEITKFVSYYQNRKKLQLNNHWICKPWNLARSLDTHITDNLDFIVRLPATGPKIAQKYINEPVLFYRSECEGKVKFDVRYVILLKSVNPLKVYIYNNFFLRFANKPFELNNFDEYEKHFTVMNYSEEAQLHHLPCADFLKQWETQYAEFPWCDIQQKILNMLKELFEAATSLPAPRGIAHNPQSRAVYAADIILSWDNPDDGSMLPYIQPKLLEINWTPDCKRACDYYPDFYNDIFSCLFLNDESSKSFTSL